MTSQIQQKPDERFRMAVRMHEHGIICAGEVWNICCDVMDPASPESFLVSLTPKLEAYFRRRASEAGLAGCRDENEGTVVRAVLDWHIHKEAK